MTFFSPCSVNLAQNHQKVKTNLVTHDIKNIKNICMLKLVIKNIHNKNIKDKSKFNYM